MLSKISFSLLLSFCFSTLAFADISADLKKCSGIKNPNDRLQCYDNISKSKQKSPQKSNSTKQTKIISDIDEILNLNTVKGEFETTDEFTEKINKIYDKYNGREYELAIDINEKNKEKRKLAIYNPDTEIMKITLPGLDFVSVGIKTNSEKDDCMITHSFLSLKDSIEKLSSYTARNGIGNEVEVEKAQISSIGIAVLGKSNSDMLGQFFEVPMSRERAKDVIGNGKVVLKLKTELIKSNEILYLLDNRWSWESKGASVLITETDEKEPTMKDPKHIIYKKFMLPVRLVSLTLLDGKGVEVFNKAGTEQNSDYINRM